MQLQTPYYVVDERLLKKNLELLYSIKKRTGCKILLAQKAFSMFAEYPLISRYLDGTAASGLFEARLGAEEFGKETHVFSPYYRDTDFDEIVKLCDHIVLNSFGEWNRHREKAQQSGKSFGIRVNPEFSTQEHGIYDPCAPYSRLGVTEKNFQAENLDGIDGLHMHTLCEQNAQALVETFYAFEKKFGKYLSRMRWLNLGGGHHITRKDYDVDRLVDLLVSIQDKYGITVYLEPGEAVALNTGFLVCTVCDVVRNGMDVAIIDSSAACHMPDVLEMPYRPEIEGADKPGMKPFTYRIGGNTCLAGDIVGDYSFDERLCPGDRIVFTDMAHYSMVKNNTFNGIPLPAIARIDEEGQLELVKNFGYEDFKTRLS